jgi:hypothetical protein
MSLWPLVRILEICLGLVSKTEIMNIESERQEYIQQVRTFENPLGPLITDGTRGIFLIDIWTLFNSFSVNNMLHFKELLCNALQAKASNIIDL